MVEFKSETEVLIWAAAFGAAFGTATHLLRSGIDHKIGSDSSTAELAEGKADCAVLDYRSLKFIRESENSPDKSSK